MIILLIAPVVVALLTLIITVSFTNSMEMPRTPGLHERGPHWVALIPPQMMHKPEAQYMLGITDTLDKTPPIR